MKKIHEKINEEKYTTEAYFGAKKYQYKTPQPLQATMSAELAERSALPDLPMVQINGAMFEASRVVNINLAHSMVEFIDKRGEKYRIDATEILKMAREKQFYATKKILKSNTYLYLRLQENQ